MLSGAPVKRPRRKKKNNRKNGDGTRGKLGRQAKEAMGNIGAKASVESEVDQLLARTSYLPTERIDRDWVQEARELPPCSSNKQRERTEVPDMLPFFLTGLLIA